MTFDVPSSVTGRVVANRQRPPAPGPAVPTASEATSANARAALDGAVLTASKQVMRTGPLPNADEFAKYAAVSPAAADAIVAYMVEEQRHRHAMDAQQGALSVESERKLIAESIRASKHGQFIFAALAVLALGGCVFCAAIGQAVPATVLGASAPIMIGREVIMGWFRGNPKQQDEPPTS